MTLKKVQFSALKIALATILFSSIPYITPIFASRIVPTVDLALFFGMTTLLNTLLISINSPLDLLLPKKFQVSKFRLKNSEVTFTIFVLIGFIAGLLGSFATIIWLSINSQIQLHNFIPLLFFGLSSGALFAIRSLLVSTGKNIDLIVLGLLYFFYSIFGLWIFYKFQLGINFLLLVQAISNFLSINSLYFFRKKTRRELKLYNKNFFRNLRSFSPSKNLLIEYFQILLITLLMMLLNNGVFLGVFSSGANSEVIITISSISILVRSFTTLLNSLTAPILILSGYEKLKNNYVLLKNIYREAYLLYFLLSILTFIFSFFIYDFFFSLYLNYTFEKNRNLILQIIIIECLFFIIGVARNFLITLDQEITLVKFLLCSMLIFLLFGIFNPFSGTLSLTSGVVCATAFFMIACHLKFKFLIKNLSRKTL